MKTLVTIFFNGAVMDYTFDMPRDKFMEQWDNHIAAQGFFSGVDVKNEYVLISPANCPTVQISEIK